MIRLYFFLTLLFLGLGLLEHNYPLFAESPLKALSLQTYVPSFVPYDYVLTFFYLAVGTITWRLSYQISKWKAKLFLEIASRIGLGGMFIAASLFKIKDPELFSMLVAQYQFLPSFLVNLFSLFLPPLELITGILLIVGPKTKYNASLVLAMMLMFIVAITQALFRDLGITCGCFEIEGAQDKKGAWSTLVRDIVLLPPILFLVFRGRQCWIWDLKTENGDPTSKS